jgi:mRNA interferase MazF
MVAPDAGEVWWIDFAPTAGREQSGKRPALVLSPRLYNERAGLMVACPITSKGKGYVFEVALPEGSKVTGWVLSDHLKSVDWRARHAEFSGKAPPTVLEEVRAKIKALLAI